MLIQSGANLHLLDDDKRLPLDVALRHDPVEIDEKYQHPAWTLLQAGANPLLIHEGPDELSSFQHKRLEEKRLNSLGDPILFRPWKTERVMWMVEHGADLTIENNAQQTVLHRDTSPDVIEAAVAAGVDPNHRDIWGETPAHFQSNPQSLGALKKLGADLSCANESGNTPLHLAHEIEKIQALLDLGCDPVARNMYGQTPIEVMQESWAWKFLEPQLSREHRRLLDKKPVSDKELRAVVRLMEKGDMEALRKAMTGRINPNTFHEREPLYMQALSPNVPSQVLDFMIESGADLRNIGLNPIGFGFVHELATSGHSIETIARHAQCSEKAKLDHVGLSALGAVASGKPIRDNDGKDMRLQICQALLDAGVQPTEMDQLMASTTSLKAFMRRARKSTQAIEEPNHKPKRLKEEGWVHPKFRAHPAPKPFC